MNRLRQPPDEPISTGPGVLISNHELRRTEAAISEMQGCIAAQRSELAILRNEAVERRAEYDHLLTDHAQTLRALKVLLPVMDWRAGGRTSMELPPEYGELVAYMRSLEPAEAQPCAQNPETIAE